MNLIIPPKWLGNYVQDVEKNICQKIASQGAKFSSFNTLLEKFRNPVSRLINEQQYETPDFQRQWQIFKQIIEGHNELCVAYHLLFQQNDTRIVKIEYEPKMQATSKRIDFRAFISTGNSIWIEVKTIHPDDRWIRAKGSRIKEDDLEKRDWAQYRRWRQYFPLKADFVTSRDANGSDIWHDKSSARTHMLDYVLEFEERIAKMHPDTKDKFILVFVGNGFDWRLDELEDFVVFYKTGKHLPGDVLQDIELHEIRTENRLLARSIDKIAYIKRRETLIHPDRIIWDVKFPGYENMEEKK